MDHSTSFPGHYQQQFGNPSGISPVFRQYAWKRSLNAGSPNNSSQYNQMAAKVAKPQDVHFNPSHGTYPLSSTAPQQATTFQQAPAKWRNSNCFERSLPLGNAHTIEQINNPPTQWNNPQSSVFHYFQNTANQNQLNSMQPNDAYSPLNDGSNWSHQALMDENQSTVRRNMNSMVNSTHLGCVPKTQFQNANRNSSQPLSIPAATTVPPQYTQTSCTNTTVSAKQHSKWSNSRHSHRNGYTTKGTRLGTAPRTAVTSQVSSSRSFTGNNHGMMNTSSGQFFFNSGMGQPNNQGDTSPMSHTPTYLNGHEISNMNSLPVNLSKWQSMVRSPLTPENEDMPTQPQIRSSEYVNLVDRRTANFNSPSQIISRDRTGEMSQPAQLQASSRKPNGQKASYSLVFHSRPNLPKPTNGLCSSPQQSTEAPPWQPSVPRGHCITGSENGHTAHKELANGSKMDYMVQEKGLHCLNNASLRQLLSRRTAAQREDAQSLLRSDNGQSQATAPLIRPEDSSDFVSLGNEGQKVVAIVQPLSQESRQVAKKMDFYENDLSKDSHKACLGAPTNQTREKQSLRSDSAQAGDTAVLTTPSSAVPDNMRQSHPRAEDVRSERSSGIQCEVTANPQQAVTANVVLSEKQGHPGGVSESSVTTPWTLDQLKRLILEINESQQKKSKEADDPVNISTALIDMFWEGSLEKLKCLITTVCYRDIMKEVCMFLHEHLSSDSVIISPVSHDQLRKHHVLEHDDPKLPYTSSWLNLNDKLDDIDKEFGFPWSLTYGLQILESRKRPKPTETDDAPAYSVSSTPSDVELQPVLEKAGDPSEKASSDVQDPCIEINSSDDACVYSVSSTASDMELQPVPEMPGELDEKAALDVSDTSIEKISSDNAFMIKVLPPNVAKVIFEQIESMNAQSNKTKTPPQGLLNGFVDDELAEVMDVRTSEGDSDSKAEDCINEFCCISSWSEIILGSNKHPFSTCKCNQDLGLEGLTVQSFDASDLNHQIIPSEPNRGSATGGQPLLATTSEQRTEINGVAALTKNVKHSSLKRKKIRTSDSSDLSGSAKKKRRKKVKTRSSNDHEVPILTSEHGEDGQQMDLQPRDPAHMVLKITQKQINIGQGDSELISPDRTDKVVGQESFKQLDRVAPPPKKFFRSRCKSKIVQRKMETMKWRILPLLIKAEKSKELSNPKSQSPLKNILKPLSDSVDTDKQKPNARNVGELKLALYGSRLQKSLILNGSDRNNLSYLENFGRNFLPPALLDIKEKTRKKTPSDTFPVVERSLKQQIRENWMNNLLIPAKKKRTDLLTQENRAFAFPAEVCLKSTVNVCPDSKKAHRASSQRSLEGKKGINWPLSRRDRRYQFGLRHQGKKRKRGAVAVKGLPDHMESKYENVNHAITPLKENNILKFSVLPDVFNFNVRPSEAENKDSVSDMPDDNVSTNDKSSNKTMERPRGPWVPKFQKKYCPLPQSSKSNTIFQEFQKKFLKTHASEDQ